MYPGVQQLSNISVLKTQFVSFAYKNGSPVVVSVMNELATSIIKKGRKEHIGR